MPGFEFIVSSSSRRLRSRPGVTRATTMNWDCGVTASFPFSLHPGRQGRNPSYPFASNCSSCGSDAGLSADERCGDALEAPQPTPAVRARPRESTGTAAASVSCRAPPELCATARAARRCAARSAARPRRRARPGRRESSAGRPRPSRGSSRTSDRRRRTSSQAPSRAAPAPAGSTATGGRPVASSQHHSRAGSPSRAKSAGSTRARPNGRAPNVPRSSVASVASASRTAAKSSRADERRGRGDLARRRRAGRIARPPAQLDRP